MRSRSEIHAQADDEAEVIRFGLDEIRTHLGSGDAIPDERNVQVKAFGQFKGQGADAVVGGFADLTARVLAAVLQYPFDTVGDVPGEAAAKRERGRAFLRRFARLGRLEPSILVGRTGGDVPLQRRAVRGGCLTWSSALITLTIDFAKQWRLFNAETRAHSQGLSLR